MISSECARGDHDWPPGCLGLIPVGPAPGERMGHHVGCECDCHKSVEELAEGKNYQRLLTGQ